MPVLPEFDLKQPRVSFWRPRLLFQWNGPVMKRELIGPCSLIALTVVLGAGRCTEATNQ